MNILNIKPRTIFCKDNLDILQSINSKCVDLIYLDPPFNKKKVFTAPIGSSAEGAEFSDIFRKEDIKQEWVESIRYENYELHHYLKSIQSFSNSYNYCYLVYMAIRLIECHRVLKSTGSIYLHCDPTMSHYLKIVLDCIFSEECFRNEIIWHYRRWTGKSKKYQKLHDIIFFYTKTKNYTFNTPYTEYTQGSIDRKEQGVLHRFKKGEEPHLVSNKQTNSNGVPENDVWHIPFIAPSAKERTGYPTQKPLSLLQRIIKASTNANDVVFDPFCGCATTLIAAEILNRKWIGIDMSHKAYDLVRERLNVEVPTDMFREEPNFSTEPPKRTDINGNLPTGNIYIISNPKWDGEYKVGIANNVKTRLNSYQTSDPDRLYKLEYSKSTPHYKEIEKHIHDIFENRHEWVRAKLQNIITEIENYT